MSTTSTPPATLRVAVTQAEPVWLDLAATVDKTVKLIEEAAKGGAKLVAFPETWIPGYPTWIWWVASRFFPLPSFCCSQSCIQIQLRQLPSNEARAFDKAD